jgi:hypothetical protein
MSTETLADFRVGGWNAEMCDVDDAPTEPVQVVCDCCKARSPWFTYRDDGGADRTTPLSDLVAWAQAHVCPS